MEDQYIDLPERLRKQLKRFKLRKGTQWRLVKLLEEENKPLTIDDIMVLDFRKNQRVSNRQTVSTLLSTLCQAGVIRRVKAGIYEINKQEQA